MIGRILSCNRKSVYISLQYKNYVLANVMLILNYWAFQQGPKGKPDAAAAKGKGRRKSSAGSAGSVISDEEEEVTKEKGSHQNQFSFVERATQTMNLAVKVSKSIYSDHGLYLDAL